MKNIKDKKIILLISILALFTIIYFVTISKISYAFDTTNYAKESYNSLLNTIKECAKVYASKNTDIFNGETVAYLKVQDLIDAKYLVPNDGENVVSPYDNETILNSNIIKIKKDGDNYIVDIESQKQ